MNNNLNQLGTGRSLNVQRLVGTGILTALVIVLQTFASGIRIGPFTPTLTLIPIVIGAIIYGKAVGALLGFVFGIVVLIAVISGAEPFSLMLFQYNPVATISVVLLKGAAAGFFAALLFQIFSKKSFYLGVGLSALIAPIANTGIFALAMLTVFYPILVQAAGAENPVTVLLVAFIGTNFLFELIFNLALIPVIIRIINAVRKQHSEV